MERGASQNELSDKEISRRFGGSLDECGAQLRLLVRCQLLHRLYWRGWYVDLSAAHVSPTRGRRCEHILISVNLEISLLISRIATKATLTCGLIFTLRHMVTSHVSRINIKDPRLELVVFWQSSTLSFVKAFAYNFYNSAYLRRFAKDEQKPQK